MHECANSKPVPGIDQARIYGFTLLELMITIAVLSIMIGIAVPSFRDMVAEQNVRAVAGSLHSSIVQARAEAVRRNINVTLRPATGETWSDGWLMVTAAEPADSAAVHRERLAGGVTVTASSTNPIVFRPSGRPNGGEMSFELTSTADSSKKRCVKVSLSGQAKSGECADDEE